MPLSNAFKTGALSLVFQNSNLALIGDATGLRGSSTAGSLYIALHTADPGAAGDQTTSEATFTSYARVAVARSGGAWTVSGTSPTQVVNAALVQFPMATGGSNTITHFSVGVAASGASMILWSGALTSSLPVSNNIRPEFAAGALSCNIT